MLPGFESELRSEFRALNGELICSGVLGSEGDNSALRGARPKPTSYMDSPDPKPHSTQSLMRTGVFRGFKGLHLLNAIVNLGP